MLRELLNELTFAAQVRFHPDVGVYSVTRGDITILLPSGKRVIPISQKIDNVISVEITRVPDSALYFVFVFGEKYVSITGVTATENKHFGEKPFESGVSFVQIVS